jgi:hypothetical protein
MASNKKADEHFENNSDKTDKTSPVKVSVEFGGSNFEIPDKLAVALGLKKKAKVPAKKPVTIANSIAKAVDKAEAKLETKPATVAGAIAKAVDKVEAKLETKPATVAGAIAKAVDKVEAKLETKPAIVAGAIAKAVDKVEAKLETKPATVAGAIAKAVDKVEAKLETKPIKAEAPKAEAPKAEAPKADQSKKIEIHLPKEDETLIKSSDSSIHSIETRKIIKFQSNDKKQLQPKSSEPINKIAKMIAKTDKILESKKKEDAEKPVSKKKEEVEKPKKAPLIFPEPPKSKLVAPKKEAVSVDNQLITNDEKKERELEITRRQNGYTYIYSDPVEKSVRTKAEKETYAHKKTGQKVYDSYGFTYMPPESWSVPQQRPPVCLPQKGFKAEAVPLYTAGTPLDALEIQQQIMPKFKYEEVYDPKYYYPGWISK